jgi:hypothetical protein
MTLISLFNPFVLTDLILSPMVLFTTEKMVSSLDLLGRRGDQLDFIEFKKAGTPLTRSGHQPKSYIDSGQLKVACKIIDVSWPEDVEIAERD